MSVVKEKIRSLIEVKSEGKEPYSLVPIRSDEIWERIKKQSNVLEQEYVPRRKGEYSKSTPGDFRSGNLDQTGEGDKPEDTEDIDDTLEDLFNTGHCDGYIIGGVKYNAVAMKTTTAVLENNLQQNYYILKFQVNFSMSDKASIEAALGKFVPSEVDLAKGRQREIDEENKMVFLKPNVNGFSVSFLIEELNEKVLEDCLNQIRKVLRNIQGRILEETCVGLLNKGAGIEELMRAQGYVGMAPKARKQYEQELRKEGGVLRPLTKEDVDKARDFVDSLNDSMDIMPLTSETIEIKFTEYRIQSTGDAAEYNQWKSEDRSYTYFTKGNAYCRIRRVAQEGRKTPIMVGGEQKKVLKPVLEKACGAVIAVGEAIVRKQLGYNFEVPEIGEDLLKIGPTTEDLAGLWDSRSGQTEGAKIFAEVRKKLEQEVNEYVLQAKEDIRKDKNLDQLKEVGSLLANLKGIGINLVDTTQD